MAQGKKNVRVRKSVGVLPYNNAAWDMIIFLHYEHLFVTKIVINAVPVLTAHYMDFRYYSLARVDINRKIDVQALCDPKTLLRISLGRDYVKCFYLLLVY